MRRIVLVTTVLILLLGGLFSYQWFKFNDGKLHIVFCNVGQGDGIFMRTPSGLDILIDGGPDDSVLSCLSSHMPFWDRTIELMFLSHPHADHMRGLLSVMRRYNVLNFNTENLENDTVLYREVMKEVKNLPAGRQDEKSKVKNLYAGDIFRTKDGVVFRILHPSKNFLLRTSPSGNISESKEFASLIILVSHKDTNIFLTSDSQIEGLTEVLKYNLPSVKVLQVPHHGSRFGLDQNILNKLNPKLAVISVGKNSYGHPSKQALDLLKDRRIKILRTDKDGEISLVF